MKGFDLVGYFVKGGWVMWPILGCSVLSLMFTLERLFIMLLERGRMTPTKFLRAFDASMKKNNGNKKVVVEELAALCAKRKGVCGEIMGKGLSMYQQSLNMGMKPAEMKEWLTKSVEEQARISLPELESHLGIVSTMATVSPLLGLFGTVVGMVQSFEVMASSPGGAKPDELAAGISLALITTVGGLVVAIPSVIFYSAIKGAVESYVSTIEEAAVTLIDALVLEGR